MSEAARPFDSVGGLCEVPNVMPLTSKIGIGCRQVAAAPSSALVHGEQRTVCATRCPWALGARVSKVGLGGDKHNLTLKRLPDRFCFRHWLALWPVIRYLARLGVQVQQVFVNLARNLELVHTQLADALGKRSHVTLAALIADLAGLDRRTVASSLEQVHGLRRA